MLDTSLRGCYSNNIDAEKIFDLYRKPVYYSAIIANFSHVYVNNVHMCVCVSSI